MSYRWMPILGKFDTSEERLVFKGRSIDVPAGSGQQQPQQQAAVGILLSDYKMANGRLRATVNLNELTPYSVCELIINHDITTKSQLTAGLGGSFAMFSIRQWVPPSSSPPHSGGAWTNYQLSGDRDNLRPGVTYDLDVRVEGSIVVLEVNGVEVATATLPSVPSQPGQTGLFCVSQSDIEITGFIAERERPKAFIVMQFSSPYNEVYSHVIKDLCDEFNLDAIRADEIYGPGIIVKDVIDRISRSQVISQIFLPPIQTCTSKSAMLSPSEKPIILLAQRRGPDAPLPFDLSAFRVLFYDDSIGGKPKLEAGLREHLQEILGRD